MNTDLIKTMLPLLEASGITPASIVDNIKPQIIDAIKAKELELQKNIFFTISLDAEKINMCLKLYTLDADGAKIHAEIDFNEFLQNMLQ
jgi:hypothetical protein